MTKKNNVRWVVGSLALIASTTGIAASPSDSERFNDFWTPGKPPLSACKSPLLVGTPLGLPHCMQASNVLTRLQALEDIASLNGGNRAAAQPGYQAAASCTSTNSSVLSAVAAFTTSFTALARPSMIASAMPRAYSVTALAESSLPGIT